jgi:hypothetical protein
MNRFHEAEALSAIVRAQIPSAAVQWLAALREPLQALTTAALNGDLSDEDFINLVDKFSADLPGLMDTLDHDALAKLMEESMGAAMANGIAQRKKP